MGNIASDQGYYSPPSGEVEDSPTAETFQRILNNDPGITGVGFVFADDLADIAGRAIGQSIHLRRLDVLFCRQLINVPQSKFLKRLAENRTIEHLTLSGIRGVNFNTIFAPFFTSNHNLRCIEMSNTNLSMGIPSLVSAVRSSGGCVWSELISLLAELGMKASAIS